MASAKMTVVFAGMPLESAKRNELVRLRGTPFGLVRVGVLLLAQPHLSSAMPTDPLSLGRRSSSSWPTHPTPSLQSGSPCKLLMAEAGRRFCPPLRACRNTWNVPSVSS